MYVVDKNNVVTLTRGDTMKLKINLTFGTFPNEETWELEEGDIVYFGLMYPNQPFEKAFLKKEYTVSDYTSEGNLYAWIYPEDTIDLRPGTYYYAIKVLYNSDEDYDSEGNPIPTIDTVIQNTKFTIVG